MPNQTIVGTFFSMIHFGVAMPKFNGHTRHQALTNKSSRQLKLRAVLGVSTYNEYHRSSRPRKKTYHLNE